MRPETGVSKSLLYDPQRPIALLIRRAQPEPHWSLFGQYESEMAAEAAHEQFVAGRGITAWSWWGPTQTAALMLADASYEPAEHRP